MSAAGTTRLCRTTTDEATHNQITTTQGFLRGEYRAVAGGVKAKPLRGDLAVNLDPARDRRCPKPGKNPKKRGVDRPRSFRNVRGRCENMAMSESSIATADQAVFAALAASRAASASASGQALIDRLL